VLFRSSGESFARLIECRELLKKDDAVRVAILTGADGCFCTGFDLKYLAGLSAKAGGDASAVTPDKIVPDENPLARGVGKPIIAAIDGFATAGGFALAINSDLRIATHSTKFGIREAQLGRGSPWAVPAIWQLPQAIALELMLTGDWMPAEKLYRVGWINELVTPEMLMPTARRLAEKIRDNAPLSVAAAKKMWYKASEDFTQQARKMADEVYAPVYMSEDAVEGPKAFAEKRKPVWKGK